MGLGMADIGLPAGQKPLNSQPGWRRRPCEHEEIAIQVVEECLDEGPGGQLETERPSAASKQVALPFSVPPPPGLEDVICHGSPNPLAVPQTALGLRRHAAPASSQGAQPLAGGPSILGCAVPELVRCAEHGDEAAVLGLLRGGEDPNQADDFGLTALHGAAKKGHRGIVALLIQGKADVNRSSAWRNETPLHYACKYGRMEVVRLLMDSRADLAATSSDQRTPQQYALEKKHTGIFEMIVSAGIQSCEGPGT
mmetsp:Transcript_104209/g.304246  ORF Transcript_104209/g.304246 Transcript_104209/m.304246 type:complete len:253 (-) Transcript_104209:125-883(-)